MGCSECAGIGASGRWHMLRPGNGDGTDTTDPLAAFKVSVNRAMNEAFDIMVGRQADYGPYNIARAWPDPTTSLIIRVGDKLERLKTLHTRGGDPYGERVRDSWIDVCNYGLIGLMVSDGTWPGLEVSE